VKGLPFRQPKHKAAKAAAQGHPQIDITLPPVPLTHKRSGGGGGCIISNGSLQPASADLPPSKRPSTAGGSLPCTANASVRPACVVPTVPAPAAQGPLATKPPVAFIHCSTGLPATPAPAQPPAVLGAGPPALAGINGSLQPACTPATPSPLLPKSIGGGYTGPVITPGASPQPTSPDAPNSGRASNGYVTPAQQQLQQCQWARAMGLRGVMLRAVCYSLQLLPACQP
jgi:hypothetical protein